MWVWVAVTASRSRGRPVRSPKTAATRSATASGMPRVSAVISTTGPGDGVSAVASAPIAIARTKIGCRTPSDSSRRKPKPLSRTGKSGVISAFATPTTVEAAGAAAEAGRLAGATPVRQTATTAIKRMWMENRVRIEDLLDMRVARCRLRGSSARPHTSVRRRPLLIVMSIIGHVRRQGVPRGRYRPLIPVRLLS